VKTRLIGLLAALAAAIIVVGGCGSSGDSSTGTTAEGGSTTAESVTEETTGDSINVEVTTSDLTKAEFVQQANAICAKNNKELNDQFQAFLKENNVPEDRLPTEKELSKAVDAVIEPVIGTQIDEIQALGAPAGEEEKVEKILTAAAKGVKKSEEEPALLLNDKGSPFDEANKLSREYGLQACSE